MSTFRGGEKGMKFFMNEKKQKGITLVALVITIIVLLILAGVTIATLTGDNGILTNATQAKFKNQMAELNEELQLFIAEKTTENPNEFLPETLNAGLTVLEYNTKTDERGDMYQIFSHLPDQYASKVEVIKGELIINTTDRQEIKWLQELGMTPNPYRIEDGVLKSSDDNLLLMDSTGTLVIPSQVTKIDNGAFTNTEGLKTIILPDSLIEIGDYAFSGNSTLEKVVFGNKLEKIGSFAFQQCTALKEVIMPDTVKIVGDTCFYGCYSLEKIHLSNDLTVLEYRVLSNCPKLVEIILPEKLQIIESSVFEFSNAIETIEILSQVTDISSGAFAYMKGLKNIVIHPNNSNYAFENGILLSKDKKIMYQVLNYITTLAIPDTVTEIRGMSLAGCDLLTSISIPKSVISIHNNVFVISGLHTVEVEEGNLNFESDQGSIYTKGKKELIFYHYETGNAVIPEGVELIRGKSFFGKYRITSIQLPESLKTIDKFAFDGLSSVTHITIPKNVTYLSTTSFHPGMQIEIDPENPNYQSIENILVLSKDGSVLEAVSRSVSEYTIPDSVKKINTFAFYATLIRQITLPTNLQEISDSAFDYCTALTKIEIPSSVTTIASSAFSRCNQLSEIRIHKPAGKIAGSPWSCPYGERAVKWDNE